MIKVAGGIILAIIILVVVIPLSCGMCIIGGGVAMEESAKADRAEQKATVAATAPSGESVMYRDNCNVRSKPSTRAKKIGVATGLVAYPVVEKKGHWRKLYFTDGTTGWTGCRDTK
jgi:uncharacterized protein YgiM (DUF1202 family)